MLYSVLPAVVQSRIPTLPSIRRALSDIRGPSIPFKTLQTASEASLPRSPPPDYTSRPTSVAYSQHSSRGSSFDSAEDEEPFQEALSDTPASSSSTPPPFSISETRTGIKWKYANQGTPNLATQAYAESQSPRLDDTSVVLTRQMYIHSLTYLLRGLPPSLSPEETLSLQVALPPELILTAPCSHKLSFKNPDGAAPPSDPSLLHRLVAITVFETFVLLQFLLPYIKLFLGHAYRFERKHNVAQRLVNSGIMGADAVRRTGLQLTHTICQMNDGKVGVALSELSLWLVWGVTGGLQQGIQDGVNMMGEERPRIPGYVRGRRG
ncbi:hypothetical protein BU23DRAFT_453095 [Bimuria novae-zelandiae CBS 107.79]|uniref:Uncharacterized protein n=1 Tax=Bimuria novae-zelandiae CBS 107.79 TaxID=1447943 RepID=A0A6A5VJG9_9PLEO|nr:hypothetical protein BU23DRAFT_453095 [Bimuria novae-zelandiae CBS 107.79]